MEDGSIFSEITNIVLPVFIIIGVGYFFSRYKKIDLRSINEVVLYITTPCLIVSSLSKFPIDLTIAGKTFLSIAAVVFLSMVIGLLIIKLLNLQYRVYLPPILFANTGNMGLPLVYFAFGQIGFNVGILCMVAMTILHYSLGVVILSSYRKPLEVFRLPLIYSTVIGILISVINYDMPVVLDRSIELLGEITIPAMIFSLGYKLSELRLSKIWLSFLFGILRIALGVLFGIFFADFFELDGVAAKVVILECSMPPAVFNFVLAEKYKQDSETVASIIMAGTIVSLFVIPFLISYLLKL